LQLPFPCSGSICTSHPCAGDDTLTRRAAFRLEGTSSVRHMPRPGHRDAAWNPIRPVRRRFHHPGNRASFSSVENNRPGHRTHPGPRQRLLLPPGRTASGPRFGAAPFPPATVPQGVIRGKRFFSPVPPCGGRSSPPGTRSVPVWRGSFRRGRSP